MFKDFLGRAVLKKHAPIFGKGYIYYEGFSDLAQQWVTLS